MITKEQAVVGARVSIPTQKTAGTELVHFNAELNGGRMEWTTSKSPSLNRKMVFVRHEIMKPYELPYLVIDKVSTFKDDGSPCITLRRDDASDWLGNDTFSNEDIELYG